MNTGLGAHPKMLVNRIMTLDKSLNIADFSFLLIYKAGPFPSSKILNNTYIFKIQRWTSPYTLGEENNALCDEQILVSGLKTKHYT